MATREESNYEQEIIDDEELDKVVGGNSIIIFNSKDGPIPSVEVPKSLESIKSSNPYDSIKTIKTFRIGN